MAQLQFLGWAPFTFKIPLGPGSHSVQVQVLSAGGVSKVSNKSIVITVLKK